MLRPPPQLVVENLFLRKPVALYVERQVRPRRGNDAICLTLVGLSRFIEWRQLLVAPCTVHKALDAVQPMIRR
jgi:hypothetical protein